MNRDQIIDNFLYISSIYLRLTQKNAKEFSIEDTETLLKLRVNEDSPLMSVDQHQ